MIRGSGDGPDVLIVGGGPAGSATAFLLAGAGWSVTVLERAVLPRPKACGECLNPGAVAALRRLGLLEPVLALAPAVLDGWTVRSGGADAVGSFPAQGERGLALPRDRLDAALLDAARRRGARVEEGVTVRTMGPPGRGGARTLLTREAGGAPREHRGRVVVGADGLRSVVARSIGAPRRPPRLRKLSLTARVRGRRASTRRGLVSLADEATVGLAPVDAAGELWNLTVVVDARVRGRAVGAAPVASLLGTAARLAPDWLEAPRLVAGPWASGPFDWPMRTVAAEGVVLVGDAAGYFDPLTGQGIYRALRSAELAAEAIDSALRRGRVSSAAFGGYRLRHRAAFGAGRAVQRGIEVVISTRPLREGVVGLLARRPAGLDALLAVTGDSAPVRSLLGPSTLAALLLPGRER